MLPLTPLPVSIQLSYKLLDKFSSHIRKNDSIVKTSSSGLWQLAYLLHSRKFNTIVKLDRFVAVYTFIGYLLPFEKSLTMNEYRGIIVHHEEQKI